MGFLTKLFILSPMFFMFGCGVKGSPLPPMNPPPISKGVPESSVYNDSKAEKESSSKNSQIKRTQK
jgi:hypothetical protein